MTFLKKMENVISAWPGVSVHGHRFGGTEFRLGNAEVGHVHFGGIVDIPFPRPIRDALLDEGLAEEHHFVPNSGWTTFRIRNEKDYDHALWLMRLSYVRYSLKSAADAHQFFAQEAEALRLTARFQSLLEPFIPRAAAVSAESIHS